MTKLVNRTKMTTATTGTGTITLGSAVDGYQTFAAAGVANSDVVRYVIEDGDAWEIGLGTYSSGTLTRGSIESSNSDLALNLTGNAVVYVSAAAADLQELVDFADNFVLPTADGSTGQVLQTNGAGALSFTTISGYTNSDVDTHLNTGTASSGEVLSWTGSDYDWVAVSGGATSIDGLSDAIAPASGSVLALGKGAFNDTTPANTFLISTAVGVDALKGGAQSRATAVGSSALRNLSGGTDATAVGANALYSATSLSRPTAVGSFAGYNVTTASDTVAVGAYALYGDPTSKLTGASNTGLGYQTGYDLSTGAYNFLGGYQAGTNLTTGSNNVALGNGALDAATTGGRNIAIGQDAMGLGVATNSTGDNIAIGYQAGYDLTSGTDNVFIGESAGSNITGSSGNVALGTGAAKNPTTASDSVVIGNGALGSGAGNVEQSVIIGYQAGFSHSSNGYITAVGARSLRQNTTGRFNVAIGNDAGYATTTGQNNVFLGYDAGDATTTGSNQIVIGQGADASSATVSNEITLGNSSITRFRIPAAGIDNTSDALSGTTPSVDVGARDTYTLTTSGNTTFTFTGAPSSGQVGTFSLIITAGGTHTLTWPASVDWAGGTAPDAPASGEKDIYTFMTVDGGTTWYGFLAGDAMA